MTRRRRRGHAAHQHGRPARLRRALLADIRRFATSPATRFQHPDATVTDAVLAAIQLEVIANAEGDLADPAEAHERSWRAADMAASFDWCGFFAMENYMQSNLDSDLKRGFFHVTNVEHYFTYRYAFGTREQTRVMKWIYAEDAWHELQDYHTARGSVRTWIDAAAIEGGGALDIRAGDIVLIDHSGTGAADHIVMVHSFDMTTNTLFTIGGNDGGYEVDTRAGAHGAARGDRPRAREARGARGRDRPAAAAGLARRARRRRLLRPRRPARRRDARPRPRRAVARGRGSCASTASAGRRSSTWRTTATTARAHAAHRRLHPADLRTPGPSIARGRALAGDGVTRETVRRPAPRAPCARAPAR